MNNFKDLPLDIQLEIFSYIIRCKADNNLLINKVLHNHINNKYRKCKFVNMLGKKICSKCWKKELNQIKMVFNSLY